MKRIYLQAMLLCAMLSGADAATYFADPAGGGAASCVDRTTNVCTLTRAIVVAVDGDSIEAACGTYSQGATTVAIVENLNLYPYAKWCAIITGTNATSIVSLTAANNATPLTFGAFDVQNTGGATSRPLEILNAAYDQTVVLQDTLVSVGGTNRHISDAWTRGTIKLNNVSMIGTLGNQAGFYSNTTLSANKKIIISGGRSSLIASASNGRAFDISRQAGATQLLYVNIENHYGDYVVPSGLGAGATGYNIVLTRVSNGLDLSAVNKPPMIRGNTFNCTATAATTGGCNAIQILGAEATATGDNVQILNNRATCNTPAGYCIGINNSTTAAFIGNAVVAFNTVTNPFYNGSATPHGIACNTVDRCQIIANRINGFAVSTICSISTNCLVSGNVAYGAFDVLFYAKGNTSATFLNNTGIMDDAAYGARISSYGCLGTAIQGATNNIATTFQNNFCYVKSGTAWKYAVVDASQVANFERNHYYSLVTLSANPWSYQGSSDSTVSAWNTRATVGTDFNANPRIKSDWTPLPNSPLIQAGQYLTAPCANIVTGYFCKIVPDIGAFQTPER